MVSVFSKVAARNSGIIIATIGVIYCISAARIQRVQKRAEIDEVSCEYTQKEKKKARAKIDAQFFRQFKMILKIIIPGFFSRETAQIILIAALLIGRTKGDTLSISNATSFERAVITQDVHVFRKTIENAVSTVAMAACINSGLRLSMKELECLFRSRLTKYMYEKYLRGITYYKMSNLDNRISNPEQYMTQDVSKFCTSLVQLYANTTKPILNVIIITYSLAQIIGPQIPLILLVYSVIIGLIISRLRRPAGEMFAREQKLEGELRYVNSRLITNSEEVAFYHGHEREKTTIMQALQRLVNHLRMSMYFDFVMHCIDNIFAKYTASLVTSIAVFLHFLSSNAVGNTDTHRFETYNKCKMMLMKLAEVISRLVMATHNLTQLAGLTARITKIMTVLEDLNKGSYVRTLIDNPRGKQTDNATAKNRHLMRPGVGVIINKDNIIKFDRVPLMTPNDEVLVEDLSFEVKSGMNVLVHGPNGCGKSSLFRILGELWPLFGGVLTKPMKDKLFYIPQRPYMTLGTLRDQIIYPDNQDDMKRKGVSDVDLEYFLEMVQLTYLLEREAGWNSIKDWMDQLSGGEKQRIAMARLFYHRPQFAILDECTSAVSVDVEGSMYQYCKEVGITLFTVSHRKSLWKYHEFTLYLDGRGGYKFQAISEATEAVGS